jgi:hypothetical protein
LRNLLSSAGAEVVVWGYPAFGHATPFHNEEALSHLPVPRGAVIESYIAQKLKL